MNMKHLSIFQSLFGTELIHCNWKYLSATHSDVYLSTKTKNLIIQTRTSTSQVKEREKTTPPSTVTKCLLSTRYVVGFTVSVGIGSFIKSIFVSLKIILFWAIFQNNSDPPPFFFFTPPPSQVLLSTNSDGFHFVKIRTR